MRLYVPLFSITLLLSATLLFSIQPMFSKMLLPFLGGTPQVWNTAMLFFQAFLLAGYAYAHITGKYLSVPVQAALHIILLAIFVGVLPATIPAGWEPGANTSPAFWQLSVMTLAIGGPFFVVSGSAPMLQHWFSGTSHKDSDNPYFLYGASNLGSMAALLSYPTVIEPLMTVHAQSQTWLYGYIALIFLTLACAALTISSASKKPDNNKKPAAEKIPGITRIKWIALSFVPSSLMLGVTTYITTDIASVPLLWIMPFALYVSTFIIVFARKQILNEKTIKWLLALAVILLIVQMIGLKNFVNVYPFALISIHMIVFFFMALSCHYRLAQAKPSAANLTEFYFFMSLGGVLGGIFNALIAPEFFIYPLEYPLALAAGLMLSVTKIKGNKISAEDIWITPIICGLCYTGFFLIDIKYETALILLCILNGSGLIYTAKNPWHFALTAGLVILLSPLTSSFSITTHDKEIYRNRNFFGVHKIINTEKTRIFVSGVTNHGAQPLAPKDKLTRISYYSKYSPLTEVFDYLNSLPTKQQHIAALGLGIGVVSCYTHQGRSFDFFEIDKDVAKIAENRNYFTYLSDCGSPHKIFIGDGRLEIEKQPDHSYDTIVIDVFSSDNIPVHIMTVEALKTYFKKLKENGIIVIHISNKYLDLEPVFHEIGKVLNVPVLGKNTSIPRLIGNTGIKSYPAHYIVMTKSPDALEYLKSHHWTPSFSREGVKAWTDQYSNILSVLGNYTAGIKRREKPLPTTSTENATSSP